MRGIDAGRRAYGARRPAYEAAGLACAAAALAALMLAGCGASRLMGALSLGPAPGWPVPASALPRLHAIADSYARGDSQITPEWASVVTTSHRRALASAGQTEEATLGFGNITVYLLTMKGRFFPLPVPTPLPGSRPVPAGNYLSVVVDAATFQVIDLSLGSAPPTVAPASLGPVTYLKGIASPAPPAAGRHAS